MSEKQSIGVIGATSLVGGGLLPMLAEKGWRVAAFSRHASNSAALDKADSNDGVTWFLLDKPCHGDTPIPYWVCLAPIWIVPEHFDRMLKSGAKHIVALSSTSVFTKVDSSDVAEQALAQRFAFGEKQLADWADSHSIAWTVLRPTLIYGLGRDKNISQIARLIKRFGFFPLLGESRGLRQPIHLQDLAAACIAALELRAAQNRAFNVSGGEVLSYREMVTRIFIAMKKKPRFIRLPLWTFRAAVAAMRILPPFRNWSPAMAERMNQDMVFDHSEATRLLGFAPRGLRIEREDLPS